MENEKTREKLTRHNMTWSHLTSPRKRYIKDESGKVVGATYDRLWFGWQPSARPWLANKYTGTTPVMLFMLGDKNIVFVHQEGAGTMYVNRAAGAQAMEYVHFYADKTGASIEYCDDLPTAVHTRNGGAKVDSLEAAIAAACGRQVEDLGI